MDLYYVRYKVPHLGDKVHQQGPWPLTRALEEQQDICGYDGVVCLGLEQADSEEVASG